MTNPATPRIEIVFAAECDVAVIFRRGPTKWTQLIRWDLSTDTFELGSWLRGRVTDASLSHDGRLLIYKVVKPGKMVTYVALSRPPWANALTTWSDWRGLRAGEFVQADRLTLFCNEDSRFQGRPPGWLSIRYEPRVKDYAPVGQREGDWVSPHGRRIHYADGVLSAGHDALRELLCLVAAQPERVRAPAWAEEWPDAPHS